MKKILNNPAHLVPEALDGLVASHPRLLRRVEGVTGIVRRNPVPDKVALIAGGGSGHEPLFAGFIGDGLLDGVCSGSYFTSPTPECILKTIQAVDSGRGVFYPILNYAGDVMNFDVATEMAEELGIQVSFLYIADDVASAPPERAGDRRGIAGALLLAKILGAAAREGADHAALAEIGAKVNDGLRSMGIALTAGTIPSAGKPTFELPADQMEFGMGIHGEPGIQRVPLQPADQIVTAMMERILADRPYKQGDRVCLLVNNLGATTYSELMVAAGKAISILDAAGIAIHHVEAGTYCTSSDMSGLSLSLLRLDDQLERLYDAPAWSPAYKR